MAASDSTSPFFLVNIASTRGPKLFAKISPEDAALVLQHRWRISARRGPSSAGRQNMYVYAVEKRDGKYARIKMHRLLLEVPDGMHVDHINGDGLDNRRENLRVATPQQNQANSRKHIVGHSRFKGVCWSAASQKWRAYIAVDRKQTHLGLFDDEIEAAKAYDRKAREVFGDRAFTNVA